MSAEEDYDNYDDDHYDEEGEDNYDDVSDEEEDEGKPKGVNY